MIKKRALLLLLLIIIVAYKLRIVHSQGTVGIGLRITGELDSDGDGLADNVDEDDDNDGISDENDYLTGNYTYIREVEGTGIINLTVNNSYNYSKLFNGTLPVNLSNSTHTLVDFNWVFNISNTLNLRNLTINRTTNVRGGMEMSGLKMVEGITKNFYIERLNLSTNSVCVKDMENATIRSMSADCISSSEKLVICDGTQQYGYTCHNLVSRYKVIGLSHSAGKEFCLDNDGDGYGTGCANGNDCDDNDASKTTDCSSQSSGASGSTGGASGGGSGAGGGGGAPPAAPITTDFSVDKANLKVTLKQGQTKTETFTIKNTGTSIFDIKAYLEDIGKFKVSPEANEVTATLQPNEEKVISLVFKALENEKPDIYPARITFKSPSVEKEVSAVIEVDSAEPLFDVDVEVLPSSKSVFPGEEVLLEVNLFNVRGFGRVDVNVEYSIRDFNGTSLATEHETLAVETQAKFTRTLLVPSDLKPGKYVAFVKVLYADSVGVSSGLFEVKAKSIRLSLIQVENYKFILLGGAAIAAVIAILIFSAYQFGYVSKKAPKSKAEESRQLREEEKAKRLRKELEALESAHKSGFISEESYQKEKKRLEEKLNKRA